MLGIAKGRARLGMLGIVKGRAGWQPPLTENFRRPVGPRGKGQGEEAGNPLRAPNALSRRKLVCQGILDPEYSHMSLRTPCPHYAFLEGLHHGTIGVRSIVNCRYEDLRSQLQPVCERTRSGSGSNALPL